MHVTTLSLENDPIRLRPERVLVHKPVLFPAAILCNKISLSFCPNALLFFPSSQKSAIQTHNPFFTLLRLNLVGFSLQLWFFFFFATHHSRIFCFSFSFLSVSHVQNSPYQSSFFSPNPCPVERQSQQQRTPSRAL